MRNIIVLIVLTTAAAAAPAAPIAPADKAVILDWARSFFADPYAMRSTGISAPFPSPDGHTMVCIEYNARSVLGGYTGIDRQGFVWTPAGLRPGLRGLGGVTNLTCFQPGITMRPFPELSQIR